MVNITNEDWEQLYSFFNDVRSDGSMRDYNSRLANLLVYVKPLDFRMFCYLIDLVGFNERPQVVSNFNFARLGTKKLYRGSRSVDHLANLLVDFDYHKGDGNPGPGIYAANNFDYAARFYASGGNPVLTFKLSPDTKVIERNHLSNIQACIAHDIFVRTSGYTYTTEEKLNLSEIAKQNYRSLVDFGRQHKDDPGFRKFHYSVFAEPDAINNIAVVLGYDAVLAGQFRDNYIILNRGKICVSQKEFSRITKASRLYKGGVIDFDKKSEDEFLNE